MKIRLIASRSFTRPQNWEDGGIGVVRRTVVEFASEIIIEQVPRFPFVVEVVSEAVGRILHVERESGPRGMAAVRFAAVDCEATMEADLAPLEGHR